MERLLDVFSRVSEVFWFLLGNVRMGSLPIPLLGVGFLLPVDLEQHLATQKIRMSYMVFLSLDFSCFFHAAFCLKIMLSGSFWLDES